MIKTRPELTTTAAKAAQILERGGTISEAARAADVSRPTIYSWIKHGVAFQHNTLESRAASELARKTETTILARLAFGAIGQILSNDELPAGIRARVALAVLEHGNIDGTKWGVPDPVLELDAALPKPAVAALTAAARGLYTFTPALDTNLTAAPAAARPQTAEPAARPPARAVQAAQDGNVNQEGKSLYTSG